LDLVESGVPLEEALGRFPRERASIEPLVRLAASLREVDAPSPSPSVFAGIDAAMRAEPPLSVAGSPSASSATRLRRGWHRTWSLGENPRVALPFAAAAVLLLLLGTALGVAALGGAPTGIYERLRGALTAPGVDESVDTNRRLGDVAPHGTPGAATRASGDAARAPIVRSGPTVDLRRAPPSPVRAPSTRVATTRDADRPQAVVGIDRAGATGPPTDVRPAVSPTSGAGPSGPGAPSNGDGSRTSAPTRASASEEPPTGEPPTARPTPSASIAPPTASRGPSPEPSSTLPPGQGVTISVMVADLDGAPLAGATVLGWEDVTNAHASCATGSGGACDLRLAEPGVFVVAAELPEPSERWWFDGKRSRDEADRIVLDSHGSHRDIFIVLPAGIAPEPSVSPPSTSTSTSTATPSVSVEVAGTPRLPGGTLDAPAAGTSVPRVPPHLGRTPAAPPTSQTPAARATS
jgi:hypothetical protein